MEGKDGRPAFDLKKELLGNGKEFAFFQAIRLLRFLIVRETGGTTEESPVREHVRIRPNLSLAHPGTELSGIEKQKDAPPLYLVTANFLGLYGESSPLPAFYTEDLIDEREDKEGVSRDFVDIFNYPLYYLFYEIWSKHRLPIKVLEEKEQKYRDILFSLLGLGVKDIEKDVPESYSLLRYIGLLTQSPKSAKGLKTLLADALAQPDLDIVPAVKRKVRIPDDQRFLLGRSGNVLGEECYLGSRVEDRMGKYRIEIGPVKAGELRRYLPEKSGHEKIKFLSRLYLVEPRECDLKVILAEGELEQARLGEKDWCRLGQDTWIFSGRYDKPAQVVFQVH